MILGLRHVGIVVSDLEASVRFYRDLLGFQHVTKAYEFGRSISAMLGVPDAKVSTVKMIAANGGMIELLYFDWPSSDHIDRTIYDLGLSHIALTVQNIEAEYQRLRNCGVRFVSPPVQSGACRVCFGLDPDLNKIEFVQEMTYPRAA